MLQKIFMGIASVAIIACLFCCYQTYSLVKRIEHIEHWAEEAIGNFPYTDEVKKQMAAHSEEVYKRMMESADRFKHSDPELHKKLMDNIKKTFPDKFN